MTGWEKKILRIVQKINPENPIEYVRNIVKEDARIKLDHALQTCKMCDISSSVHTVTRGSTNARILILSGTVAPDQEPKAWNLIVSTLQWCEIDIADCFFMHTVNCCPFLKLEHDILYRIPNLQEEQSCKPYLDRAIEIIKPKFMILLGNVALNSLVKANVDTVHGQVLDIMGIPSIATFSPDYLLWCQEHNPDAYECEKSIFLKDFEKISEELKKEHL